MPIDPHKYVSPRLRIAAADAPRRVSHQEFLARRAELLARLADPQQHPDARDALEALYVDRRRETHGLRIVRDSADEIAPAAADGAQQTGRLVESARGEAAAVAELRSLIAASLEDGLLRHSRREFILAEAARRGLTPFNAHLLIAQVQFGGRRQVAFETVAVVPDEPAVVHRLRARLAAVGLVAAGLFFALVRWSGIS